MSQYNIFGYKRPSTASSIQGESQRKIRSKLQPENSNRSIEKQIQRPSSTKAFSRKQSINSENSSKNKGLNQLLNTEALRLKSQNQLDLHKRNHSASYQMLRPNTANEASFVKQEIQMCHARNQLSQEMDKNQEYFNHLKGKCLCAMCTCGHCKCRYGYIKEKSSLIAKPLLNTITQYQSEFHKFPKGETKNLQFNPTQAHPSIKLFSPTQLDKQNYNSTYVTSYQKPGNEKTNPIWPSNQSSYGNDPQFVQQTQYQDAFKNWKDNPQELQKYTFPKTIIEQPFKGESIYKHVYKQHSMPKDSGDQKMLLLSRQPFFKSPINPSFNINYQTQTQDTYCPKQNKYTIFQAHQQALPASFPLLCRTTYQTDFGSKNNICPAKQLLYKMKNQISK